MKHKFNKTAWDAAQAKKKAAREDLKAEQVKNMNSAQAISGALSLALDALGLEYGK